ncbi:carboxypeptidase-like regulatory domain-containing protein [Streptomyces sp. NPDC020917]|uniref:carboxypeptidase-like regulatory domain-containing protein n=1 Tax=Streptomyces sp. NPDC020917 TaxID=3365102 RepID=UPI00379DD692
MREAWVAGVRRHFPGEPMWAHVASWDETPGWERFAGSVVFDLVHQFIVAGSGGAALLTREQKGQFVAACWTAQVRYHVADPKPGQVADWGERPVWERETWADVFEAVELFVARHPDPWTPMRVPVVRARRAATRGAVVAAVRTPDGEPVVHCQVSPRALTPARVQSIALFSGPSGRATWSLEPGTYVLVARGRNDWGRWVRGESAEVAVSAGERLTVDIVVREEDDGGDAGGGGGR